MVCKLCGCPIQYTFGTLFLAKSLHVKCEQSLQTKGNVTAFPFFKGLLRIDYLLDKYVVVNDASYIERHFLWPVITRAIKQNDLIIWKDDLLDNDVLYLLFKLDRDGIYWIFIQNPIWIE